jgi:hypothetical protein
MKTSCKKLMLICTAAIVTSGLLVSAQDVKKDKRKNNVTIQDIQPVFPGLLKEKKPGVTVANLKFNAPIEQIGGNPATMPTNSLQKVRCCNIYREVSSRVLLNNYQFSIDNSIVPPKR